QADASAAEWCERQQVVVAAVSDSGDGNGPPLHMSEIGPEEGGGEEGIGLKRPVGQPLPLQAVGLWIDGDYLEAGHALPDASAGRQTKVWTPRRCLAWWNRAIASNTIATAVASATPVMPSTGISATLSPTLSTKVAA